MNRFFTLLLLTLILSSCKLYQPRVVDWIDPFTQQRTRTMSVGDSDDIQILDAIANISQPYYARPTRLPDNQHIGMAITPTDTLLTYLRYFPERTYDLPAEGRIRIRFDSGSDQPADILDLPLLRSYHTSNGILRAVGRVNQTAFERLRRGVIRIVRVDAVGVNESDLEPVDWFPVTDYAKAFNKGVPMLTEARRAAKSVREIKPADDRGLLRRIGKKKSAKN